MKGSNRHIGSSFEDFLDEEGIREEVSTQAFKRVSPGRFSKRWRRKVLAR